MYWLLVFFRRAWAGDTRPEARRITLGCGLFVLAVFVVLYALRWSSMH